MLERFRAAHAWADQVRDHRHRPGPLIALHFHQILLAASSVLFRPVRSIDGRIRERRVRRIGRARFELERTEGGVPMVSEAEQ